MVASTLTFFHFVIQQNKCKARTSQSCISLLHYIHYPLHYQHVDYSIWAHMDFKTVLSVVEQQKLIHSSVNLHTHCIIYINHCLEHYLNQQLRDVPCMVIHVLRSLPMIAVEYTLTKTGCCMWSKWTGLWKGCFSQVYQSFLTKKINPVSASAWRLYNM